MAISYQSGDVEQTLKYSEQEVNLDSNNLDKRLTYAMLLQSAGKLGEAESQFRKCVEIGPRLAQPWLMLVQFLVRADRKEDAEAEVFNARLSLSEDEQPLFLARAYHLLGRIDDSENQFLAAYDRAPDDPAMNRTMAEFYLNDAYTKNDKFNKATEYINKLLKYGDSDADGAMHEANVLWARRRIAEILVRYGNYPEFQRAMLFIGQNALDGVLATEDRLLKATLLSSRPELESRREAMDILTTMRDSQSLSDSGMLLLADLYLKADDWTSFKATVLKVLENNPKNPSLLARLIEQQLSHGEIDGAQRNVDKLQSLAPDNPVVSHFQAQILAKRGSKERAVQLIISKFAPQNPTIADIDKLLTAAGLLEQIDAVTEANKFYLDYYNLETKPEKYLRYAAFLGRKGSPGLAGPLRLDNAFAELQKGVDNGVSEVTAINAGVQIIRNRSEAISRQYDNFIESWLRRARLNDPDNKDSNRILAEAEFRDLQGKHSETIDLYSQLLPRAEVSGKLRAMVLNNLAYNLAMQEKDLQNAQTYIAQAISIYGPIGEFLDTRAMVNLAEGKIDDAKRDLVESIQDDPTAIKHLHMAPVYMEADELNQARVEWQKALNLGLTEGSISNLELNKYKKLKGRLGEAGAVSSRTIPAAQSLTDFETAVT